MSTADWHQRLERMLRARRFDEVLLEHSELITGVFHVCIGQEGTSAALAAVRRPADQIALTHRNHHHLAALGSDLAAMFAEVFGRDRGPQRGRAGTLHLADPGLGVPYTSAMVGGGVPIALGFAYAKSRRGEDGVAFACFGDGAMGEGVVHECFNLARLWDLPVVFICESNARPSGNQANAFQAAASLRALAGAHQIFTAIVDAREPDSVEEILALLTERTRSGAGPAFLEALSEPWPGNQSFIPRLVTGPLELAAAVEQPSEPWAVHDPVLNEARRLLRDGVELELLLAVDQAVRGEVAAAYELAAASKPAEPAAATAHVWGEPS